jgi:hypothetical protein
VCPDLVVVVDDLDVSEVRAWAAGLEELPAIAPRFARSEPREQVAAYVRGLLARLEHKNSWTLAERAGEVAPDGMQRLLATADWDADAVRDDAQLDQQRAAQHLPHVGRPLGGHLDQRRQRRGAGDEARRASGGDRRAVVRDRPAASRAPDLLDEYVGEWIGKHTRDEVAAAFEEAGAAVAPVYKPSELLEDPQVRALETVTTVEDPDLGPIRMQNVLWRMSRTPGPVRWTGRADTWARTRSAFWLTSWASPPGSWTTCGAGGSWRKGSARSACAVPASTWGFVRSG